VARGSPSIHLSDLHSMFPDYPLCSKLKAQACIELPLIDSEQRGPGLIGAFYRRPLSEAKLVQSLLEMCMPRVLAELDRIQTMDRLRETVDTLRESQERCRAFVWLNPDPMWRIEFPEPIAIDQSEDDQVESIIQKGLRRCDRCCKGTEMPAVPDVFVFAVRRKIKVSH
jgi:hypothetical protein